MTSEYKPRGHVKAIVEGMSTHSPDLEWTSEELAELAGIDVKCVTQTVKTALKHGALFSARKGRRTMYSLTAYDNRPAAQAEGDEPAEFNAALWVDGDLVIYGAQENEDSSITLSSAQLAKVKRLIAWTPAP